MEGLYALLTGEGALEDAAVLHMSGRRSWSASDVAVELTTLMRRTIHASSNSFDEEDLSPKSPVLSGDKAAVSTVTRHSVERPDLAPLHEALVRNQPEGWRPLTPFRVSLMEAIATHLS